MFRTFIVASGAAAFLTMIATPAICAEEYPTKKDGYWELTITKKRGTLVTISPATIHECVDAASQKLDLKVLHRIYQKIAVERTADGYIITMGFPTEISEITERFETSYSQITTGSANDITTWDARWLGPCPDGWKPGDSESFDSEGNNSGHRTNIRTFVQ